MKTRTWSFLALVLALAWCVSSEAQQPAAPSGAGGTHFPLPSPLPANPDLAQQVVQALKDSGQLTHCRIQVYAFGNMVDLRGEVADESHRGTLIAIARSTPGVVAVRDWMQTAPQAPVMPVQAPLLQPLPAPQPINQGQIPPMPPAGPRIDGQLPEPMPIFQPMPGPNPMMQPPPMPPYAWPTVAPYNNYSRVAYPQSYAYEQWPFIGPMYPFPRVPLGWRSVSLTWQDGCWWYHRNPTGHDWWRVRYW